jgi:hypothetical protein
MQSRGTQKHLVSAMLAFGEHVITMPVFGE